MYYRHIEVNPEDTAKHNANQRTIAANRLKEVAAKRKKNKQSKSKE